MEHPRHRGKATLFGKPYRWAQDADGKLMLLPALTLTQVRTSDAPFTPELIRDAMRRLRG